MMNQCVDETTSKWRTMLVRVLLGAFIVSAALLGGSVENAYAGFMHNSNVTPESAYREYAQLFPSSGWISAQNELFENQQDSSGTLIYSGPGGSLVLTSQHGLLSDENNPASLFSNFQFGLGPNSILDQGENYYAESVFLREGYGGIEDGPDIALLYFKEQFATGVAAEMYTGTLSTNDVLDVAGYGEYGTVATGIQGFDGEKRAGQVRADFFNFPAADYISGQFRQPGHPEFLQLGIQLSDGLSGAAGYINFAVAAVATSRDDYRYGGRSTLYELQDEDLAWIAEIQASTTSVPEPSSMLLFLSAGALAALRRSRSPEPA